MNERDRHLTDEEILRWVDEGDEPRDVRVREHLDRCEECRARSAGMEELVSALAAEPPPMTDAEMAAQRERIRAAVRSRPRGSVKRRSRRQVWLPAVAAAGIAALLLWAPREDRNPATSPSADAPAGTGLPVVAQATRAAEEIVAAAGDPGLAEELVESASTDIPATATPIDDDWNPGLELEREFTALPREDREAILTELASLDLMNDSQE